MHLTLHIKTELEYPICSEKGYPKLGLGLRMKRHQFVSLMEITEELQTEILLKLPVKSLLLCQCVCKHFGCIIKNPNFVSTHLARINQTNSQSLVLLHFGREITCHPFYQLNHYLLSVDINNTKEVISCLPLTPPIPIINQLYRSFVVGSCNGLICLAVWFDNNPSHDANTSDFSILLWNPVIRQCRYLPKHQCTCRPDVLEFGFVPETNDYVIVKVASPGFHIEVYMMSTDSWKTIDCNLFGIIDFIPTVYRVQNPVFLNGSFHWAVKNSKTNPTTDSTSNYIVSYKLKDEELRLMKVLNNDSVFVDLVLDDDDRESDVWKLSVIDEKLAMIYWCGERGNLFEVWVMNDYGVENSWTRRFQIIETSNDYVCPMGYWINGMMLLDRTYGWRGLSDQAHVFFFYDMETRSHKKIPLNNSTGCINGFSSFVETLVPVRW